MRCQRSSAPRPRRGDGDHGDGDQFAVLALLLDLRSPGSWSVVELGREIGSEEAAADAVVRLHAAGLAHRFGEFVMRSLLRTVIRLRAPPG
jgi:hypothetical protein